MPKPKKYVRFFRQSIEKNFPEVADTVMREIDTTFITIEKDVAFAATSSNPMDKRLDISAYLLSLIQVLNRRGESLEKVRAICLDIAKEYVRPKNRFQQWFKRFLPKLLGFAVTHWLLNQLNKRVSTRAHPDGFVANILTDKQQTYGLGYGVDIIECGICKLFDKHNLAQYASILCEVDEITSGLAGLKLIRSGTIATGARKCDFRWKLRP